MGVMAAISIPRHSHRSIAESRSGEKIDPWLIWGKGAFFLLLPASWFGGLNSKAISLTERERLPDLIGRK